MATTAVRLFLSSQSPPHGNHHHFARTTTLSHHRHRIPVPTSNRTFFCPQSLPSSSHNHSGIRRKRHRVCSKAVDVQSKDVSDFEATALAGRDRLLKVPTERIRNFSIIAHIDHGKSTLADKLLQVTGTVESRDMKEQFLDNMDLERERGITIKLQAARMRFAFEGQPYCLNLIDTPGHVDFSYEVSRSLAACEGALLVVDASQGVEAQTLANVYLALENNLEVIPVLNKIDLPGAEPSRVVQEIEEVIGLDCSNAIYCSAKEGIGINEILNAIVQRIPPPADSAGRPLRALIFDSYYDAYRGVIVYFRVIDGTVKKGDRILFMASGKDYFADEIGVLSPNQQQVDELYAGEVGYISASIRSVADARVGDTITHYTRKAEQSLPGYKEATPMVFCGLFPVDADQFPDLRDALEKLQLNDAALKFEPETSSAMGFGFRCGFLGLLHMEIVQERLEREYNLTLITTAPSVVYRVHCVSGETVECSNPSALPEQGKRKSIEEPMVKIEMLTPKDYIGSLMELSQDRRGEFKEMKFITETRASLTYEMPLAEMVGDFFDQLKSRSKGYASMEYSFIGYKESDLIKLDVLINGDGVEPLSTIVHKDKAYSVGRALTQKLKELIPRQMFKVPIQACIGTKVIASESLSAIRKDVLAKCYGGDISRKKKLLKKQVLNKIDLPGAEPSRVVQEIEEVIGLDCSNAIYCSAKEGIGINEILNAIVQRIPPPADSAGRPLRALIFDSYYDAYRGVIVYFRVIDGTVKKGDRILFMASGKDYFADEIGVLSPNQQQVDELYAGEVGYISASIRSVADARVGDTITHYTRKAEQSLPGYKEATPMVFCGLFPVDADQFPDLRDALEKLQLNDAALKFEPETSSAMGFGFRCGFLGLLHMEIVQERLEREYNLTLITTAPSVVYRVHCVSGETVECSNPSALPEQGKRKSIEEPMVKIEMLTPKDYIGSLMELSQDRRGEFKEMKFITETRASLTYEMPLAEMVGDFFDQLKSRSKGYASMEYSFIGYKESDLIKLDVLINGDGVEPLSTIVHKDKAYSVGRALTQKLKELIPRQMFKVPIQACIGTKVIASESLSAIRKDVLAKCYGGDISRKKKLLKKQAAGKKRMKAIGKVDVPQEAFMAVLKLEKEVL